MLFQKPLDADFLFQHLSGDIPNHGERGFQIARSLAEKLSQATPERRPVSPFGETERRRDGTPSLVDFFLTGNNVLLFLQNIQKTFHILLEDALLFFFYEKSKFVEKRELGGNEAGQCFFKISLQYSTLQPEQREPPLS